MNLNKQTNISFLMSQIENDLQKKKIINHQNPFPIYDNIDEENIKKIENWIQQNKNNYINSNLMDIASSYNQIEIIKILHSKNYKGTDDSLLFAILNHNLEVLELLLQYYYDPLKNDRIFSGDLNTSKINLFDFACIQNHLDIVQFLHHKDFRGSLYIMDYVTDNLDILQFLHQNNYKCTTLAMDNAFLNRKYDNGKWLHSIGYTCTINALYSAIRYNDFKIVKWFHQNIKINYTQQDFNCLMKVGKYKINKYVRLNIIKYYDIYSCDDNDSDNSKKSNKLSEKSWIMIESNFCNQK